MNRREQLRERFPSLYTQTSLFDFSPPEGWFDIVWQLSEKLEPLVESHDIRVYQVKTKFGGLRYYCAHRESEEVQSWLAAAEAESFRTCEICGKPGQVTSTVDRGTLTACEEHATLSQA